MAVKALREAESGVLRDLHFVENEQGVLVPATRIEPARTNSISESEDFGAGAWTATVTVTSDDVVAPDGWKTADKLEDASGTGAESAIEEFTVADDSVERAVSAYVKKNAGGAICGLGCFYKDGTSQRSPIVHLDPETGDTAMESGTSSVRHGAESVTAPDGSEYWRLWMVAANNGSGNTTISWAFYPARAASLGGSGDGSQTGAQHVWGAQLEGVSGGASAPSSYLATAGSSTARGVDDATDTIDFDPQALTVYQKFVETGGLFGGQKNLLELGRDGGGGDALQVDNRSGSEHYRARFYGSSTTSAADTTGQTIPSYGDVVERMITIDGNGAIQMFWTINGGNELSSSQGADAGLPSSWNQDIIRLAGSGYGAADYIVPLHVEGGVKTLAETRALAGVA